MNRRDPIAILGVPFDNVTTPETMAIIEEMIVSRQPHCAATANVDFVAQALHDVELRRILFDMQLVLADGMPVVWASRFLGNPLPERVTGSGLIPLLLAEAEVRGWRVFFLGGEPHNVALAAKNTLAKHPRLQLVGAYSPPFKPLLEMDNEDILKRIHLARPDILLVAFGCPKQEKWINMNYRLTEVPFSVGVGATIDFLAGTYKRAPVWMQNAGLEWFYRMLQEPRRLIKRYARDFFVFGWAIWLQWWRMRVRRKIAPRAAPAAPSADLPGMVVVNAPPALSAAAVQECRDGWQQALEKNNVICDLAETRMADSTGIGLLIRLRKRARELDRCFVLCAPSPQVRSALQLMQLLDFFSVEPSLGEARLRVKNETGGTRMSVQSQAETMVIQWHGDVTADNASDLAGRTQVQLSHQPPAERVEIDLTGVSFVDSTGVGLMVRLRKQSLRHNIAFKFSHPTPNVLNVLRLLGIDAYLLDRKK